MILRKLDEETTKIRESMPLILDLEQNALFKRGLEKGLKKGQEKGVIKGLEKKTKLIAIKMLQNNMSIAEIVELLDVEADYIIAVQKELNQK